MSKEKFDVLIVQTRLITVEADNAYQARIAAEDRMNGKDCHPNKKEWFATSVYMNPIDDILETS
ncbi:MAG: hypothetical protein WC979_08365 [Candidatus Pacearchaeota archaeon]|jgi:hypothetical protein